MQHESKFQNSHFRAESYTLGKWIGTGNENCTNPKLLYESIVIKAENLISEIKYAYFDDKGKLTISPLHQNSILTNNDIGKYGRCFTAKATKSMIKKRIRKADVKVLKNARVFIHHSSIYQTSRRTMAFLAKKGKKISVDVEYQVFEMLDYGGIPCVHECDYNKDRCTHDFLERKSIKLFGCTSPFGLNKDQICKNEGKSIQAYELYDDTINEYSTNCSMPCSFLSSEVITFREYDLSSNQTGELKFDFEPVVKVTRGIYLYSELSLIAEIGGYVGLFLGVSFNQITKLTDFLLTRFRLSWNWKSK